MKKKFPYRKVLIVGCGARAKARSHWKWANASAYLSFIWIDYGGYQTGKLAPNKSLTNCLASSLRKTIG